MSLDRCDGDTGADVDAVDAMFGFVETRQRLARDPRQDPVGRFEKRDPLAKLVQHRSGFEADIAAADHGDVLGPFKLCLQSVDVGPAADHVNAACSPPGQRKA